MSGAAVVKVRFRESGVVTEAVNVTGEPDLPLPGTEQRRQIDGFCDDVLRLLRASVGSGYAPA
jgi:hypothetical protein